MLRQINFDIGKVPPFVDRILNQFQQQKKTGVFEGIGSEFLINNESIDYSTSGYCKFTIKEGFATIFGGAVYNEEGTQFTPVDLTSGDTLIGLPLTTTSTGSLGIRVDLAKPAGQQASFYYKTTQTLVQQDLNALKTSGVYEFELYKYTSNGSAVTFTKNNTVKIKSVEEDLINIKASILALTNTFAGEILYEDPTGSGIDAVDLSEHNFNDGDVLEVFFRVPTVIGGAPQATPCVKKVEIKDNGFALVEEFGDGYFTTTSMVGGSPLTSWKVVDANRNLFMRNDTKILSFGGGVSVKSRSFDIVTNEKLGESSDPYYNITKVKRYRY